MESLTRALGARHIQNMSEAETLEPHWGYADRALPCAKDVKTCAYLDLVYSGHDYSMLFVGIFWAIAIAVLFTWAFARKMWPSPKADEFLIADGEKVFSSTINRQNRMQRTVGSFVRSYLLPDSLRIVFGRTTRLQVSLLAIISAYLIIASFAGLTYKIWVVAVPDHEGVYTIRTTLGPWSNRIGVLAYALTPLTVMLASRESILSLLTGVPYQSFNFLHRWLGYIILVQALLHTIAWIVIETKLYAPQPDAALQLITEKYMIWGIVATLLIMLLFVLTLPVVIRRTGYEFFRKAHYVLAMVYIGACYAHWDKLSCFLYSSLIFWALDRALRLIRTGLIHYQLMDTGSMGFKSIKASVRHFPDSENGDVVRVDFVHSQDPWKIGQHFYLCFTECSIWQSHPFTPLSLPVLTEATVQHSYILRAKQGETKKLAEMARKQMAENIDITTPVIFSGSYGESITENLTPETNVLCVAGGTGITYVLPVLLDLISKPSSTMRKVQLIWAIRKASDAQWVHDELESILHSRESHGIEVRIFVTREAGSPTAVIGADLGDKEVEVGTSSPSNLSDSGDVSSGSSTSHPDLSKLVPEFIVDTVRGSTTVFASGPGSMVSDLRLAVAASNSGSQVWKGNDRFDVSLVCDNRLE
ncbi:uncharacterized protein FIESC28_05315 [Fusarium coffeatum]|uniref:FAD-binding FR-type domain-containing protein n=1 Tax=Fusarium coffeatum TaxID=231269 RepID=A0A366RTD6_9HYPO|nr:uncharacterized protein FIESC28_05315 [Fusarium coffeatum]RBR20351.1 hypothetical protein FIESC28_05315 [Fusarium coffeatum]